MSLSGGAIRGWDKRSYYYFQMLQAVADHYKFSLTAPFEELDKKYQDIVLYGSKGKSLSFKYINERGDVMERKHPFEGIIPNMERRYRETESIGA